MQKNIYWLIALILLTSCGMIDDLIEEEYADSSYQDPYYQNTIDTQQNTIDTQQNAIDRHNQIRSEVFNASGMIWDETLATTAQEYANYLASTGKFEHDYYSGYGENLFAASYIATYTDAINSWYEEKAYYDYNANSCSGVCGHYTQIVWKNSTHLGCAKATYTTGSYQGGIVIVCRYNPAGNYIGQRPY